MRTMVLGMIGACCLMLCTSCDGIGGSSPLVGEWGGSDGRSMIFYPDGRVAVRDRQGLVPNCTYRYDAVDGVVIITRPEGAGTMTGQTITAHRMEFRASTGKPIIFNRKGT